MSTRRCAAIVDAATCAAISIAPGRSSVVASYSITASQLFFLEEVHATMWVMGPCG